VYEFPSTFLVLVSNSNFVNLQVVPGAAAKQYFVSQIDFGSDPSDLASCNAIPLPDPGLFVEIEIEIGRN
jgi:hypothetical protein